MLINTRLRWLGALFLIVAASMLIWGQTVLKPYLAGMGYVVYWLFCFGFTGLAMLIALLDMRAVRRQLREQHLHMIQRTLTDVQSEARESDPPAESSQIPSSEWPNKH